jgi:hypothetical protein
VLRRPSNQRGHAPLFVTCEGLSAPARRAIADELRGILATGAIRQVAEAPARTIAADPGHRRDVPQDPERPSLHFRLRARDHELGVLPSEARTSIRQETLPPAGTNSSQSTPKASRLADAAVK